MRYEYNGALSTISEIVCTRNQRSTASFLGMVSPYHCAVTNRDSVDAAAVTPRRGCAKPAVFIPLNTPSTDCATSAWKRRRGAVFAMNAGSPSLFGAAIVCPASSVWGALATSRPGRVLPFQPKNFSKRHLLSRLRLSSTDFRTQYVWTTSSQGSSILVSQRPCLNPGHLSLTKRRVVNTIDANLVHMTDLRLR